MQATEPIGPRCIERQGGITDASLFALVVAELTRLPGAARRV